MTLFRNRTHSEIWRQRWCETCFQPDEAARRIQHKDTQCPIWAKAMASDRKPPEWDRMPRAEEMERTIRCNSYQDRPPRNVRLYNKDYEEIAMFDLDEALPVHLVPVDGWPDYRTGQQKGGDHQ